MWPSWYSPTDPNLFAVGMPDGASPEQIPLFREFGIPHPLDTPHPSAAAEADDDPVEELQKLAKIKQHVSHRRGVRGGEGETARRLKSGAPPGFSTLLPSRFGVSR